MLTTSRREVSLDDYNSFRSTREVPLDDIAVEREVQATRPRATSYFSQAAVSQKIKNSEPEYSAADIAAKLFGEASHDEVVLNSEDLRDADTMPSMRTMDSANTANLDRSVFAGQATVPIVVSTNSLSKTKTKVIAASYLAVVLILAIAIVFSAVSVNSVFAQSITLEADQLAQVGLISAMATELSVVDKQEIITLAESMGYSLPNETNTVQYTLPEMRAGQTFNVQGNWFDNLCDSLSNLIGG